VQLLNQQQDLSEEQINQVLNQVDQAWAFGTHRKLWRIKQEQYDSVTTTISDYLRNTGKKN